jgi:hypothetical protein
MSCYQTAVQRKAFDRAWKQSVPAETVRVLGDSLRAAFDRNLNYRNLNDTDMKESSVVGIAPNGQTSTKG